MRYSLLLVVTVLLAGCSAHRTVLSSGQNKIARVVQDAEHLGKHDFGFAVYDPTDDEWLYQRKAAQYFTPASNTKILTLYASTRLLPDHTVAFYYHISGDTLHFWGAADPALLYHLMPQSNALDILASHPGPVYYAPRHPVDPFGAGWAWDDYPYAYQVERSTLPLYGNRIRINILSADEIGVQPPYMAQYVTISNDTSIVARRISTANGFEINPDKVRLYPSERSVPFVVDDYLLAEMLSDTLGRKVELTYNYAYPPDALAAKGTPVDTLYRRLMHQSDNFVAEQLLLQAGMVVMDTISSAAVIKYVVDSLLSDVPDPLQWYDGSGLSRYNLFTPRSVIHLLNLIRNEQGMAWVSDIFPAGGVSGTIAQWYGDDAPYVWAKTGTLRNKHCLSGYLQTRKGRTLIFSFMHQNYIGSSRPVKEDMERILEFIRDTY